MIVLVALVLSIPTTILRGTVAATLWGWFVSPVTGLPEIGVAVGVGLAATASMLVPLPRPMGDGSSEALARAVAFSVLTSLLALATGWVALQFVGSGA